MKECKCGALLPRYSVICCECNATDYDALADDTDTEWVFDDEAFVKFLDEGE